MSDKRQAARNGVHPAAGPGGSFPLRSWLLRSAGYFALWVLLIGTGPADLVVGVLAAGFATWTSLALLPPGALRLRLVALPGFVAHFLWQSIVAGVDVARRAFSPSMPLKPGLVRYDAQCPRGTARNTLASVTSLLPGTLTVDDDTAGMLYHCLDTDQPVLEQLAAEEAAISAVIAGSRP